jgi:S-formylglutathione hydrolase FrmB
MIMALLHAEMYFPSLHRSVPLQVILPVDKRNPDGTLIGPKKFKTLYLLHGLVGSCGDWVSHTRILRWAQQLELAVVMPSGDNSFYVDRPVTQNNYGQFIGQELVEMTRRMFPLSDKREDTFLAGLSMGGFGALRNGLKYYETFGYVASLSGAVDILADCPADPGALAMGEALFGPAEEALASDKNPRVLIRQLGQAKKQDPTLALPKL